MSSQPRRVQSHPDVEPDLCDPAHGRHAFQSYIREAYEALAGTSGSPRRLVRPGGRETIVAGATPETLTPSFPPLLADLAIEPPGELLVIVPGQVVDAGRARHRVALLQLGKPPVDAPTLARLVPPLLSGLLPGRRYRLIPAPHALLKQSMDLELHGDGDWQPLGHCGLLEPGVLEAVGLPVTDYAGAVIELGLEQLHRLRGPLGVAGA